MNKNISFKKIESSTKNTELFDSFTTTSNNKHNFNVKTTGNLNENVVNQSVENKSQYVGNSINSKSIIFQNLL